jgi:hypothetical protein
MLNVLQHHGFIVGPMGWGGNGQAGDRRRHILQLSYFVRRRWLWRRFWDMNGQQGSRRHHIAGPRMFIGRGWFWRQCWDANGCLNVNKHSLDIFPRGSEISTRRPGPFP